MSKELYLYSGIYDFVAESLMQSIDENLDQEIVLRVNSPGGGVFPNYGICAKVVEHGNITAKVDGAAMSSACNLLFYVKRAEALDVSTFLLHRADMYISSPEDQEFLNKVNKDLRAKMLKKIDAAKFKEITGVTIDDLFDSEKRVDVVLTAKQAKAIGLIQKINVLTPTELNAFNEKMFAVAAKAEEKQNPENPKNTMKTIEELEAAHPALFAQVKAKGVAEGIQKERDRVEACLVFLEVDPAGVKAAVESGKELSGKQMAEFVLKQSSPERLAKLKAEGEKTVETEEPVGDEKKAEAKKNAEIMAGIIDSVKSKING